ncbi:TatD family hydrolase [Thalassotalea sediminis]|uniref:TatD family hydrolase n=1 Tax=Thalassotalea sediminis TaxID=1759089 RepID=UPI0025738875|nr:TatD family hydrolase [Thalassotalea sediminis]
MLFTDSHCHLDFEPLSDKLTLLLEDCSINGIHRLIIPSVAPNNWQSVLDLKHASKPELTLFPCLGIHPWYLNDLSTEALQALNTLVAQHIDHIVAIGECGIDGKIANEQNNLAKQQYFFKEQIKIANDYAKPIIIHHRRTHNELIEILKKDKPNKGGFLHGFSGSYQQAITYIDMGFKLGIGGTITYERAEKTRKAIKRLPLDALVLETDAPAMPLSGEQGSPNSPLNITKIFKALCLLRDETPEQIAQQLELNIDRILHA